MSKDNEPIGWAGMEILGYIIGIPVAFIIAAIMSHCSPKPDPAPKPEKPAETKLRIPITIEFRKPELSKE